MKFIVAGYGFVGSAIGDLLEKNHEVVPVDPRLNNNKIEGKTIGRQVSDRKHAVAVVDVNVHCRGYQMQN